MRYTICLSEFLWANRIDSGIDPLNFNFIISSILPIVKKIESAETSDNLPDTITVYEHKLVREYKISISSLEYDIWLKGIIYQSIWDYTACISFGDSRLSVKESSILRYIYKSVYRRCLRPDTLEKCCVAIMFSSGSGYIRKTKRLNKEVSELVPMFSDITDMSIIYDPFRTRIHDYLRKFKRLLRDYPYI